MLIANTPKKLHHELDSLRHKGGTRRCVSLVTTRGELHQGHGAVINAAKTVSDIVVVAIVPYADRHLDNVVTANEFHDISFVEQHDADVLYMPSDDTLCPFGIEQLVKVTPPPECKIEFDAIAMTLHLKIINTVQPDIMVWGEKKFVEYFRIRQMISDLDIRTQIQCIPTVRHANGAAVSSHDNVFDEADQSRLPIMFETLNNAAHAIRAGARAFSKVEKTARLALTGAGFDIGFFSILDERTLTPASENTSTYRIISHATLSGIPVHDSVGLTL